MLLDRDKGTLTHNLHVLRVTEKDLADVEQQLKNTKPFKDTILSIGWYAFVYMIGVYVGVSL